MTSSTPFLASLSKVQSKMGLFITGKRSFGLVQLRGRSLVPNPPAKISAFSLASLKSMGVLKETCKSFARTYDILLPYEKSLRIIVLRLHLVRGAIEKCQARTD